MFENKNQLADAKKLWQAMDEVGSPACTNFPDLFFPENGGPGTAAENAWARATCAECPLVAMCAEFGIKWEAWGMWGGITAKERQSIRVARGWEPLAVNM